MFRSKSLEANARDERTAVKKKHLKRKRICHDSLTVRLSLFQVLITCFTFPESLILAFFSIFSKKSADLWALFASFALNPVHKLLQKDRTTTLLAVPRCHTLLLSFISRHLALQKRDSSTKEALTSTMSTRKESAAEFDTNKVFKGLHERSSESSHSRCTRCVL